MSAFCFDFGISPSELESSLPNSFLEALAGQKYLPGHPFVLHSSVSVDGPRLEQSFPPCCGTGLVHFLLRKRRPPPHEIEQSAQTPHSVYPPLT